MKKITVNDYNWQDKIQKYCIQREEFIINYNNNTNSKDAITHIEKSIKKYIIKTRDLGCIFILTIIVFGTSHLSLLFPSKNIKIASASSCFILSYLLFRLILKFRHQFEIKIDESKKVIHVKPCFCIFTRIKITHQEED